MAGTNRIARRRPCLDLSITLAGGPPVQIVALRWRMRFALLLLPLLACNKTSSEPAGRFSGVGTLTADDAAITVFGGATSTGSDGPLADAWRYELAIDTWTALGDMPDESLRGVAAREGDTVTVFGGSTTGWGEHAWLWQYDQVSDAWSTLEAEGPEPRFKHAAALHDGTLWMIGGRNNDGETEVIYGDCWTFELSSQTWTEVAATGGPVGIHRHAMAWDSARELFWVHGGFQPPAADPTAEPERSDRMWTIDPAAGAWTERTWSGDGPPIRASHALAVTEAGIVVWGGNASDTSTWRYDPEAETWAESTSAAPLARDAMVTDVTSDGGTLVLVGGDPVSEDVPDFVMDVWTLDLGSLVWTELREISQ